MYIISTHFIWLGVMYSFFCPLLVLHVNSHIFASSHRLSQAHKINNNKESHLQRHSIDSKYSKMIFNNNTMRIMSTKSIAWQSLKWREWKMEDLMSFLSNEFNWTFKYLSDMIQCAFCGHCDFWVQSLWNRFMVAVFQFSRFFFARLFVQF